jgi:SAM-dependent methyltransferase
MTPEDSSKDQDSIWTDEYTAELLRLRVKTFYNVDYFDHIILPLIDIPYKGQVLDVGCGHGGLTILLGRARPDLEITGVDVQSDALGNATQSAKQEDLQNVKFEHGDAHKLVFKDEHFDAVVCQTLLTHVRDANVVVQEMARVLKPGGLFFAAEYTVSGAWSNYDNLFDSIRDEGWHAKYFRLRHLYNQGKLTLELGDEQVGNRVPLLATEAGLEVYDFRLNDRALCVIPPYNSSKQKDYLEFLRALHAADEDNGELEHAIKVIRAAGGTDEDATWLSKVIDDAAILEAIEKQDLTMMSSYNLYLTFARKPAI